MIGTHAKTQLKKYRQSAITSQMPAPSNTASTSDVSMEVDTGDARLDEDAEDTTQSTLCTYNAVLFDDLSVGEFFSPSVLEVDRVLAVEDDDVDTRTVNWENAVLPGVDDEGGDNEKEYLHGMDGYMTVKVRV